MTCSKSVQYACIPRRRDASSLLEFQLRKLLTDSSDIRHFFSNTEEPLNVSDFFSWGRGLTIFNNFTIVPDFALKCYQCQGSEAFCHKSKLKRNHTYDACNRYHKKCITKRFQLEAGAKEVTRGCGNDAECRISAERCKRKGYTYRCYVTCCEEDYCNKGSLLGGQLCDAVVLLGAVFLSLTVHFNWAY